MIMTRRAFAGNLGKASATMAFAGALLTDTACFFADVEKEILQYSPVALAALQSVLDILAGNGIKVTPAISTAVALYKTGLADLQTAVTQYQNAPQGQKSTLLAKVSEALTVAEQNINVFWDGLNIPDQKLADLIAGLLGVVTTTMEGFATQLPPAPTAAKMARFRLSKTLSAVPKKRSVSEMRKDFNSLLKDTGESQHAI